MRPHDSPVVKPVDPVSRRLKSTQRPDVPIRALVCCMSYCASSPVFPDTEEFCQMQDWLGSAVACSGA